MTVSDATIEAEGSKDFFKSVGNATVNFGKKVAKNPCKGFIDCKLNWQCGCK